MRATHNRAAQRLRQTLVVGGLLVLATWSAACSSGSDNQQSAPTSPPPAASSSAPAPTETRCENVQTPGFPDVDRCDVESVMTAVAARIYTFHPATENSPEQAFWAASPLMTQTYRDQVGVSAAMLASVPVRQWQQWASDDTRVQATARVTSDEHPTAATRVVVVTQHFRTRTGGTAAPDASTVLYMGATQDPADGTYAVSAIAPR